MLKVVNIARESGVNAQAVSSKVIENMKKSFEFCKKNYNLKDIEFNVYETDYFLSEKEIFKIKELKIDRQTRFKQEGTLISESMDLLEIKFLKNLKMFLDNIAEDYVKNTLEITNKIKNERDNNDYIRRKLQAL
jgi:hypothetical protein